MLKKISNIITVGLIGIFVFSFMIWSIIKEPSQYSLSERRKLAQFPDIQIEKIKTGETMKELSEYMIDQFPLRDGFLSLNSTFFFDVLQKKDVNGLYVSEQDAIAMEYPYNPESLRYASSIFSKISKQYLNHSNRVYLSIIPDKSYFLEDQAYLKLDYQQFVREMKQQNQQMQYIDIMNALCLDDYYDTDPHWRQERIVDVAKQLAEGMGVEVEQDYDVIEMESQFYGSYYHRLPYRLKPETLYFLTNETIQNCIVYDHQNQKQIAMYDLEKINDKDAYELYLSGPLSYITIENPKMSSGKELIIFRDSFGSSIAPLLASGYHKITLIDIRYLPSSTLDRYIQFEGKDILFLYSTSVLNHSKTLK